MPNGNLRDVEGFVAIAQEGSFARAAARLDLSRAALDQTVRQLEERVGLRLLTRTARSVSLTEAGQKLYTDIEPALDQIDRGLASLISLREHPSGTLHISADEFAIRYCLWPRLNAFLHENPDVGIELTVDYGLSDIVQNQQDAGIRRGNLVSRNMATTRISPDIPMAVVASPQFLETNPPPDRPQALVDQLCINLRLPTQGAYLDWTFVEQGKDLIIQPYGRLVFNSIYNVHQACLDGLGLAYLPLENVEPDLERGALVELLAEWRKTFDGYYLYYPKRRRPSAALAALIDYMRHPED